MNTRLKENVSLTWFNFQEQFCFNINENEIRYLIKLNVQS